MGGMWETAGTLYFQLAFAYACVLCSWANLGSTCEAAIAGAFFITLAQTNGNFMAQGKGMVDRFRAYHGH